MREPWNGGRIGSRLAARCVEPSISYSSTDRKTSETEREGRKWEGRGRGKEGGGGGGWGVALREASGEGGREGGRR